MVAKTPVKFRTIVTAGLAQAAVALIGTVAALNWFYRVDEAEYPGTYLLKNGDYSDRIEILPDRKYTHRLERSGEAVVEEGNNWEAEDVAGESGITLIGYSDSYRFIAPRKSWSGVIFFCSDGEDTICWQKTN
jgi:hypothetical protein